MDTGLSYTRRRGQLETYFDRTAADAWTRLTSDAPVSGIRATVRAGRDAMRAHLLERLPRDLTGAKLLDAGCGTGSLSIEAARRGAEVIAIDISETLVAVARERAEAEGVGGIEFLVGDMLEPGRGPFDFVVAMDSLIHYRDEDMVEMVHRLCGQLGPQGGQVVFTFAPRTPLLTLMHAVGRLFPRSDRAPAIEPISEQRLRHRLETRGADQGWVLGASHFVKSGFYLSCALEVRR